MYFHAVTPDSGLSCEDTKGFFRAGLDQGCFHVHLKLSVPCHQLQLHVIQLQCLLSLICRLPARKPPFASDISETLDDCDKGP